MESEQADEMVREMRDKRIFADDEISEFLSQSEKIRTHGDMISILTSMTKHGSSYNFFIEKQILKCAIENDDYVDLIIRISNDPVLAIAIPPLEKLYDEKPEVANFLYDKLTTRNDERLGYAMGNILGGLGKSIPTKLFKLIKENKKPTTSEKIAFTLSLQISSEIQNIPQKLLTLLISYANSKNKNLKNVAIRTLVYRFSNIKKVEKRLLQLAKNDDNAITIANSVRYISQSDNQIVIKLLTKCAKTNNPQVAGTIAFTLGTFSAKHPLEILSILRKWVNNPKLKNLAYNAWFIQQVGKGNLNSIKNFLINWIHNEKNLITLMFHLPIILEQIYQGKDRELINLLKRIDYGSKKNQILILKTLQSVLSLGFKKGQKNDAIIKQYTLLLQRIASHRRLKVKSDFRVKDPELQLLSIIDAIERGETELTTSDVKKNLQQFPNLVKFMGTKKMEVILKEKSHPLVSLLSKITISRNKILGKLNKIKRAPKWKKPWLRSFLPSTFYPVSFLADVDVALSRFCLTEPGTKRIREGLLDKYNFYETISELLISSRLKKFSAVLQPKAGDNVLDLQVTLSREHLIEIYAPSEDAKIRYVRTAHSIKLKAKKVILEKINSQVGSAATLNTPIILIIDNTRAPEVDKNEIIDTIFGTYQWTLLLDNESHQVVREYASRKNDSMSEVSPFGTHVSAIILLHRDIDSNSLRIKLYGEIFLNPNAIVPLDEESVNMLEDSLF